MTLRGRSHCAVQVDLKLVILLPQSCKICVCVETKYFNCAYIASRGH